MKNISIKTRIMAIVLAANVLGALIMVVYLHQSFGSTLEVRASESVEQTSGAWEDMTASSGKKLTPDALMVEGPKYLERIKAMTGEDVGLLLSKDGLNQEAYDKALSAKGQPSNWDERENYVLAGATDEVLAEKMAIGVSADSVPEMGKLVGIENGACSKMCHGSLKGEGDFWGVAWSDDSKSRAHGVLPIADATGKPIGLLYSIQDLSQVADAEKSFMMRMILVIALTMGAATLVISFLLNGLVFRRLSSMTDDMEDLAVRIAGGDFDARFTPSGSHDEIGQFEDTFARFVDLVASSLKSLLNKSA